jgi:anti-sigma B factor antagonist
MAEDAAQKLIETRAHGRTHVLRIRDAEIYRADTIAQLGHEVRQAIEAAGAEASFVLDLSHVQFLTSAAVGLITNIHSHLKARNYPFALAGAQGEVAEVIETTRLGKVMPVFATVEQALDGLRCQ